MNIGSQSETKKISKLLLKHPKDAFQNDAHLQDQWQRLNYPGCPDFDGAMREYSEFLALLEPHVDEIAFLPPAPNTTPDAIYTHDPVIITNRGAILCNMGKDLRQGEPAAVGAFLEELNIPILGAITGSGRLEGGDVVWLDEKTLAVGRGYRTNDEGIRQLKALTVDLIDELIVVPLPHWQGPDDVLHIMSFISPIDEDLAVVYSKLMTVPFREYLLQRSIKLLEVPDDEYETMACNILAVAPRKCMMLAGNPLTRAMLEKEGVTVWEYEGRERSHKGCGGPTCLTRPLLRA